MYLCVYVLCYVLCVLYLINETNKHSVNKENKNSRRL